MQREYYQRYLMVGVLVFFLLVIETVPRLRQVTSPLQYVGGGMGHLFYVTTTLIRDGMARGLLGYDAKTQIVVLEEKINLMAVDRSRIAELETQNRALRETVSYVGVEESKKIIGHVIGHDPNDPQTILRLNIGSVHGVTVGSAALSPAGVMVGIVTEVSERLSSIQLLKNSELALPVRVPEHLGTFGILESPDGVSLRVTQIPKDSKLELGALVTTNTGFKNVPPNISVGVVSKITQNPETLWQEAQISPFVDERTLDYVLIVSTP